MKRCSRLSKNRPRRGLGSCYQTGRPFSGDAGGCSQPLVKDGFFNPVPSLGSIISSVVRSRRKSKIISFVLLNDNSCGYKVWIFSEKSFLIVVIAQLEVITTKSCTRAKGLLNSMEETLCNTSYEQHGRTDVSSARQINSTETGTSLVGQQRRQVFGSGSGSSFEQHGRSDLSGGRQINNNGTGTSHAVYGSGSSTSTCRSYNNPSAGLVRDPPPTYPLQRHQPPPPMYQNRGPVARNEAPPRIIPINALNPYSGRWTIKARVTSKGDLRTYNNPRGGGKVFSFDLLDADGGEIRVTCFNAVADQFFDQIVVGTFT
ncbi:hypothetical protein HID58_094777 [Brassica napus]|uniref:OB domain-containing protein n=1 Tax=Brassica napus TaxID=3708 RepID=A0ABQ7X8G4_BRANA|nr:hypothetical protein HID58_094777 [Brassica napus]